MFENPENIPKCNKFIEKLLKIWFSLKTRISPTTSPVTSIDAYFNQLVRKSNDFILSEDMFN